MWLWVSHRDDLKVIVTGGFLSGDWFALVGPAAIESVGEIFVDKVFIGVDGIHVEHGLTTNYPDQATIHRAMMRQARQNRRGRSSENRSSWYRTHLPLNDVDILITDKGVSDEAIAPFVKMGIDVHRA